MNEDQKKLNEVVDTILDNLTDRRILTTDVSDDEGIMQEVRQELEDTIRPLQDIDGFLTQNEIKLILVLIRNVEKRNKAANAGRLLFEKEYESIKAKFAILEKKEEDE